MTRLRYLGMIPKAGHREYGFHIDAKDKPVRQVILTIDNLVFLGNQLKIQEAPDLCYQKMMSNLENEDAQAPILSRAPVTSLDVANYRDSHPTTKSRNRR